ncbi:hypothetical protein [Planctomycetes bacterium K23_9]|uniref:Uncharacterized protein n=1 Tax=Stieleria marina TaxID=1930275 RepID=A0A517NZX1_9BACT|nr:hypothetical protein K239x_46810 [Planctomycetes bacterium K23_9]
MNDPFVSHECEEICSRVRNCADRFKELCDDSQHISSDAEAFCRRAHPQHYKDYLESVRDAARMAVSWQNESRDDAVSHHQHDEAMIDECGDESFPASDPPGWNAAHA